MSRRSQLTFDHLRPPSSDRHSDPCASDLSRIDAPHGWTPSAPVWMSAYIRLPSDGAIATSVLPYGDFGNPGSVIFVKVFPPSREMWMPLPIPPLSSTCVCRKISHVPARTTFGSFCEICRPEQPVFSLDGCTTMVPMRPVSASPIFVHVSPASVDL